MMQIIIPFVLTLVVIMPDSLVAVARATPIHQESKQMIVRGRVVSLDSPGVYGFKSENGTSYSFLADDVMTGMFGDKRVRDRLLKITAQLHPDSRLEVIKVQSILNGKLNDLYYFCELCNITAYAPGPCPCCREELEFRETPAP
jgi:hypothetical protein